MNDSAKLTGTFQVTKYASEEDYRKHYPYEIGKPFQNILVTTGLEALWKLVTSQGSITPFSNTNSYLGVGDSTVEPDVAQTDLQAATNKLRKAMDSSYPSAPSAGTEVWKATYGSSDANFSWNEFAVFNASSSGIMLNRSVSDQGIKAAGQIWQLTYTITVS